MEERWPLIDPRTGQRQKNWNAQDPCIYEPNAVSKTEASDGCLDSGLIFGGAFPWETNMLALSDMAAAQSWTMIPSLAEVQQAIGESGNPDKVVVSIYFRNPYVLDEESGVRNVGAIFATFGVSDAAQFDIMTGKQRSAGRLPFALPASRAAIITQHSDAPGYAKTSDGALFP